MVNEIGSHFFFLLPPLCGTVAPALGIWIQLLPCKRGASNSLSPQDMWMQGLLGFEMYLIISKNI